MSVAGGEAVAAWHGLARVLTQSLAILGAAGALGTLQAGLLERPLALNILVLDEELVEDAAVVADPGRDIDESAGGSSTAPDGDNGAWNTTPRTPVEAERGALRWIGLDRATALFNEGAQFVDAREPSDFSAGHIDLAISFPPDELDRGDEIVASWAMVPELPTVVYCTGGTCQSSIRVGDFLRSRGFTEVRILREGFAEWAAAGLPVGVP